LALALRDGGEVDESLAAFLGVESLDAVIDPEELDENKGGAYYGNIGRCLHLMGQIDPAIICYRKSAILIEKDPSQEHVVNQGFARKWIGELLLLKGEKCDAKLFLDAARRKWEQVSFHSVEELDRFIDGKGDDFAACPAVPQTDLERYCLAWIYGRDATYSIP
jgi:tetratricopeptide (TPR) repeat protein